VAHVLRTEDVEDHRRPARIRPVVEGQRDDRALLGHRRRRRLDGDAPRDLSADLSDLDVVHAGTADAPQVVLDVRETCRQRGRHLLVLERLELVVAGDDRDPGVGAKECLQLGQAAVDEHARRERMRVETAVRHDAEQRAVARHDARGSERIRDGRTAVDHTKGTPVDADRCRHGLGARERVPRDRGTEHEHRRR